MFMSISSSCFLYVVILVSNNDLKNAGYTNIEFSDLRADYGTCSLKNQYGRETAKCFYVSKI